MLVYLPANLGALLKTASDSGGVRWGATTGVRVISKDGTYRVETTDGRRMICIQGPNEDKEWPNMEEIPDWEGEAIVPAGEWDALFKLIANQTKDKDSQIKQVPLMQGVAIGTREDQTLLLATFKTVTQAQQLDGKFPDTERFWKDAKPAKITFSVDPDYMIETLQVLKQITTPEAIGVTVLVRGETDPIGFTVTNIETGQVADAVVLPLVKKNRSA